MSKSCARADNVQVMCWQTVRAQLGAVCPRITHCAGKVCPRITRTLSACVHDCSKQKSEATDSCGYFVGEKKCQNILVQYADDVRANTIENQLLIADTIRVNKRPEKGNNRNNVHLWNV